LERLLDEAFWLEMGRKLEAATVDTDQAAARYMAARKDRAPRTLRDALYEAYRVRLREVVAISAKMEEAFCESGRPPPESFEWNELKRWKRNLDEEEQIVDDFLATLKR
jgi:hypothetical protein